MTSKSQRFLTRIASAREVEVGGETSRKEDRMQYFNGLYTEKVYIILQLLSIAIRP